MLPQQTIHFQTLREKLNSMMPISSGSDHFLLNAAGINSHVLYLGDRLGTPRRRIFLKMLSKELDAGELAR